MEDKNLFLTEIQSDESASINGGRLITLPIIGRPKPVFPGFPRPGFPRPGFPRPPFTNPWVLF
jgi:hypothetical protein